MSKTKNGTLHFPEPFQANYIPHILKEMYIDGVYASYLNGRRDLTVLDLGANIGIFSMYVKDYAKKIIAVEPAEENFNCLLLNAESFNFKEKSTLIKAAIGNKEGKLNLYHSPNKTAHTLLGGGDNFEEVEIKTIAQVLKETKTDKVDLMKIDIEGSEFDVLCGDSFIEAAPKIQHIFGELHSWAGRNYSQVGWALRSLGYRFSMLHKTEASVFVAWREE